MGLYTCWQAVRVACCGVFIWWSIGEHTGPLCDEDMSGRRLKSWQCLEGSSGEMLVGSQRVLLMDEISTGLDSSTTYSIIKYLRDATHALQYTTLIALLQPAPETFELFDDVLLIADGVACHMPNLS